MRTHGATFVAAVLVLVGAAPAAAVTGFGAGTALHSKALPVAATAATRSKSVTACHSSGPQSKKKTAAAPTLAEQIGQKAAPVACEQAPRGQIVPPDAIKHAMAAALSVIG
jgi:hypothetical protein